MSNNSHNSTQTSKISVTPSGSYKLLGQNVIENMVYKLQIRVTMDHLITKLLIFA